MIKKSKLILILTLMSPALTCFAQQEDAAKTFTQKQLDSLIFTFGGDTNYQANFYAINIIYKTLKIPKEIKNELKTLLSFEKHGVLALFGPQGQILANYLKLFTNNLGDPNQDLSYFRMRYLGRVLRNDSNLLAEIIEFGTKNCFRFEPSELVNYFLLNNLALLEELPKETAQRIINCLPNLIDKQDKWGFTALMDAIWRNNLNLAEILIDAKANLEVKSTQDYEPKSPAVIKGSTALDIAILKTKNLDSIKLLLHSGADTIATHNTHIIKSSQAIADMFTKFKAQQKETINSALENPLPQVLINIVCEYLAK